MIRFQCLHLMLPEHSETIRSSPLPFHGDFCVMRVRAFIVFTAFLFIFVSCGQNILAQTTGTEIRLTFSVTDAEGNPVSVDANEVTILENGVVQKIEQFTERNGPSNIGLIIDNSGSMRFQFHDILDFSKRSAGSLNEKDEAFIVRLVGIENTTVLQSWTSSKSLLMRTIDEMYVEGGQTSIVKALNLAWQMIDPRVLKDPKRKYSIILISDAENREGSAGLSELIGKFQAANVQVHVIALTGELDSKNSKNNSISKLKGKNSDEEKERLKDPKKAAEKLANKLAFETGGRAFIFNKTGSTTVQDVVKQLAEEQRSQYLMSYKSNGNKPLSRTLEVKISDGPEGQKRTGKIRQTISMPEN